MDARDDMRKQCSGRKCTKIEHTGGLCSKHYRAKIRSTCADADGLSAGELDNLADREERTNYDARMRLWDQSMNVGRIGNAG